MKKSIKNLFSLGEFIMKKLLESCQICQEYHQSMNSELNKLININYRIKAMNLYLKDN